MIEAGQDVRRAGYDVDAVSNKHPGHRERNTKVGRPIVDAGQDVAMKIDHIRKADAAFLDAVHPIGGASISVKTFRPLPNRANAVTGGALYSSSSHDSCHAKPVFLP
jgi:hypothetical protein